MSGRTTLEILTVGRVGVDLYPEQTGPLTDVQSFRKFLGGTATNLGVGAARLGRRAAVLPKVGEDGFGPRLACADAMPSIDELESLVAAQAAHA